MNILIIEDSLCMAKPMRNFLQSQGHQVSWVVAVTSLQPFTGRTREGALINLSGFDLVIEDGQLEKSPFQGVDIVKGLAPLAVNFLAASTVKTINQEMVDSGALVAATKPALLLALYMGELDLSTVVSNPAAAQAKLNLVQDGMLKDEKFKAPRRQLDDILRPFMAEEFGS